MNGLPKVWSLHLSHNHLNDNIFFLPDYIWIPYQWEYVKQNKQVFKTDQIIQITLVNLYTLPNGPGLM